MLTSSYITEAGISVTHPSEPTLSPALLFDAALPSPASGTGGTAMAEYLQALQTRVDGWDARVNEFGSTLQALEWGMESMGRFLIRLYPNDPMEELEQPFAWVRSLSCPGSRNPSATPSMPSAPPAPMDVDPDTRSHVSGPSVQVAAALEADHPRPQTPLFPHVSPLSDMGPFDIPDMEPHLDLFYERAAFSPGNMVLLLLFGPRHRRDGDSAAQPSGSDQKL
jgi:hypothetical protein